MSLDYKSRMVSFRLTEEQYEEFRRLCSSQGSTSVSDMARSAILLLLGRPKPNPQSTLESRVAAIEEQIHVLMADVRRLQSASTQIEPVSAEQFSAVAAEQFSAVSAEQFSAVGKDRS